MKRLIRSVCLLVAVVVFMTIPVMATESASPRASSFFGSSSVYLYELSDTIFEAWFDVTAIKGMDELGASVVKIQRSSDGVNWTTMKTCTKEDYSNLICEDTVHHGSCIRYTGTKGYYYRARIDLYAKNSTGTGSMTRYTSSIYLD